MLFTQEDREIISGNGLKIAKQGSVLDEDFRDVFCETSTIEELEIQQCKFSDFKNDMSKIKNWTVIETYQGLDSDESIRSILGDMEFCAQSQQHNDFMINYNESFCSRIELTPAAVPVPKQTADVDMEDEYEEVIVEEMDDDEDIQIEAQEEVKEEVAPEVAL